MSPELILASYSWARRDHIVRLTRARPLRVSSAFFTSTGSDSLRMPTLATFAVGTRSVILSFMKLITNSSSFAPAISCSSMARIWPTPWAGYTTNWWVLKPWRWINGFFSSTRGATAATGFAATTGLAAATGALTGAAFGAAAFGAILWAAGLEAATFEAVA